ncbi:MAG: hypothetical protein AAFV07_10260 [Bacteroidota bacterium]
MRSIILWGIMLIPLSLLAQPRVDTRWQIGLGYTQFKTLDLQHSPLMYRAHAGQLSAQFARHHEKGSWQLGLTLAAGGQQAQRFGQRTAYVYDPYDIYGERDSVQYVLNPAFSFGRASLHFARFWRLPVDKVQLEVGFRVEDVFHYAGLGAATWFFNQLTLAPAVKGMYPVGPGRVEAEISSSLIAYTLGLPYVLDPSTPNYPNPWSYVETGSHLGTVTSFRQAQMKLAYSIPLGSHEVGLGYRLDWLQSQPKDYQPLSAYGHTIQFTYNF